MVHLIWGHIHGRALFEICLVSKLELRSLPCGHSFCLDCLERVRGGQESLPCPLCRKRSRVKCKMTF